MCNTSFDIPINLCIHTDCIAGEGAASVPAKTHQSVHTHRLYRRGGCCICASQNPSICAYTQIVSAEFNNLMYFLLCVFTDCSCGLFSTRLYLCHNRQRTLPRVNDTLCNTTNYTHYLDLGRYGSPNHFGAKPPVFLYSLMLRTTFN